MNKSDFKHGQRVTCEIKGTKITDAVVSIDEDGYMFICQNEKPGDKADNKLRYIYSWCIYSPDDSNSFDKQVENESVTNLRPLSGFYPQVNDIVIDEVGVERKVLEVLTQSFLVSRTDDFDVIITWYTFKEAEKCGWKIKGQEEETLTISGHIYKKSDVEDKLKDLEEV